MKTIVAGSLPKRNLFSHIILFRWLKKSILLEIIAILYMSMFLYTAISKWSDYTMTREQMALMPLMTPIAHIVVWLLPAIEIVITLLIFLPQTRIKGLYVATTLMILFTLYIIYMMLFYPNLPCSCGGFLTELSWPGHLVFNGVFIVLGILGIRMYKHINLSDQQKN
ncbi:MAG TPA: MauE/DoxX family redox-associated membrane protein [Niastella sp.]